MPKPHIGQYLNINIEGLQQMGVALAGCLKEGDTLCLIGDLGAGKTTLAQVILKELGVQEPITSPTYTIINSYGVQNKTFYHMDAYRINDLDELFELGFEDMLYGGIRLIEWANLIEPAIPSGALWIELHYALNGRDLILRGAGPLVHAAKEALDHVYTGTGFIG